MSSMDLFSLIAGLLGGLALFMYGMNVMSGGLTKAAGGKLEAALSKVTSHPVIAYLFGVGVTALVQSSSASTVMVVGLVNSGIMTLKEAVNVILGANLGTTFTAWLLSLNAISSDNFLINLLKPTSFTPFLAIIGIVLYMFSKSDKKNNIGLVLIGFSVLMFGMSMMSDAVSPLKNNAGFQSVLMTFSNPFIGFLVGVFFTMVIQSSAGTIGIMQALAASVHIPYSVALPVVVGAEVGTCITAILSSLGANKNGKRTALMHLYFNIIKAGSFMIIFYIIHSFVHFAFMDRTAGMVGIASIHTLINLVATPLMLPFAGLLVKMAYASIPIDDKEREEQEEMQGITKLDPRFLTNPPFALEQSKQVAMDMAEFAREGLEKAIPLLENYNPEVADEVRRLEEKVDRYEDQLGTYLMQINNHHLAEMDSRLLSIILHCITDFERISDHTLNIAQIARNMNEKKEHFSSKASEEIRIFSNAVREIVDLSFTSFQNQDLKLAQSVEPLEEVIDGLNMEVKRRHVRRLRKGKCTIDMGFSLSELGTDYERIADHCSNIAVCLLEVSEGMFDTHEYIEHLKEEKNQEFEKAVDLYERKYRLPAMKKGFEDEDEIDPSFAENHAVLVDIMKSEDEEIIDEALAAAGVKKKDKLSEKVKDKLSGKPKDKEKSKDKESGKDKSKSKDKKDKKEKSKKSKEEKSKEEKVNEDDVKEEKE
ncbi:phosphate:Na+ symporter [Butyrivibrio sp. ob235]|uniref:Na/Pi cotransporter family protein n=1 Tax=Butyrivibrio sp. ob235 TaxID=1761780 RepID=UPI0008C72C3B|nr:Na/Pi cotransporter family protein [Butyrivibrio sp. ob235]SEK91803.1 phosphate:Na+ symporter [Butyrivibrio sp. ob235]